MLVPLFFLAGAGREVFGDEQVLVLAGVVYVFVALSTLLSRSVRDLERVGHTLEETPAKS